MARPKPTIILEHTDSKTYRSEQVLEASDIYAVFYEGIQSDGFVSTYEVYNNGTISPLIDTFEFDETKIIASRTEPSISTSAFIQTDASIPATIASRG